MIDDPLTTCPECGAAIRRVLFPAGVVFKGSGFYKTDHRDSASTASSAKDEPVKADGENGKAEPAKTASDGKASKGGDGGADNGSSKPSTPASGESTSKPAATPA